MSVGLLSILGPGTKTHLVVSHLERKHKNLLSRNGPFLWP